MRTYSDYQKILELWAEGCNKSEIAHLTKIPRATIRDCIVRYKNLEGLEAERDLASRATPDEVLARIQNIADTEIQQAYAYLLGMYLGDGYIVRNNRVYFLRIFCATAYPDIINSCSNAIQKILPHNKIYILPRTGAACNEVIARYKFWPEIFPQHGAGRKHEREIALETWQQEIVDRYPLEVFRGLYHSDGSRDKNRVNGKEYPRYGFTNMSDEIRNLFCHVCDLLGLHWTVARRGINIHIARRKDVAYLDSLIGPKS